MKILKRILLFFNILVSFAIAQNTGYIAGVVQSLDSGQGLPRILVKIQELDHTIYTDAKGEFLFEQVPAGIYTLTFLAPGYGKTILLNVEIVKDQTWYDVIYLQKTEKEGESFYIGGIEVTADRDLLPDQASTTTKISSGEIEHLQASSLGDALELIPGQKFTNPGLEGVKQIELRQLSTSDDADRNASLGTQILIDGVPLSNNANMQIDTDLNDGATYRITANAGVDLRQIPADNIKSIEVIRGIPSVKFGDLSAGAVVVNTKTGYTPYRFKYKYNPRSKEYNVAGGYPWENHTINFNVNYAKSLRNIRVEGDAYSRVSGQISTFSKFNEDKLNWNNRFYLIRTFDEQELRTGDVLNTERYNRDYLLRYTTDLSYNFTDDRNLESKFSVSMDRQNSYIKRDVSRDVGIIGTRTEPGLGEGLFTQFYTSVLKVNGRAWNFYGDVTYEDTFLTGNFLHKINLGLTGRYEFNDGPGRIFDPETPPRSSANGGDRPRSYSSIPGLSQYSIYAEDELTGHLWKDFSLQFGARLDLFGFTNSQNMFKVNHGTFLNPRINFVYYLGENTQFRAGYGRNAKSPTLSMIYPNPVYFDVVDSSYYNVDFPDSSYALVNTYVIDRTNTNLKAYTRDKFEISVDQRIGLLGLSLTGFLEQTHNGFETGEYAPISFNQYSYPDWPNTDVRVPRDTLLLNYGRITNGVEAKSRGIEMALTTKKLPFINTTIRVDAAYHFTESHWQDNHYVYGSRRKVTGFDGDIIPYWKAVSSEQEQLLIHYRLDTKVRKLGLWFTLNIQQLAMEKDRLTGLSDSLALGYLTEDGQRHDIAEEHLGDPEFTGLRRVYDDYQYITEDRPNLWLLNLRVSKELWKGSEVSFYVNNMFNSRPVYQRKRVPEGIISFIRRNPEIYYGLEFSTVIDDFIDYMKRF